MNLCLKVGQTLPEKVIVMSVTSLAQVPVGISLSFSLALICLFSRNGSDTL